MVVRTGALQQHAVLQDYAHAWCSADYSSSAYVLDGLLAFYVTRHDAIIYLGCILLTISLSTGFQRRRGRDRIGRDADADGLAQRQPQPERRGDGGRGGLGDTRGVRRRD